jgi:uncharacterized membrane protein
MIRKIIIYFFQGTLFAVPIFITVYVILKLIVTVGSIMDYLQIHVHPLVDPILGVLLVVLGLIVIGIIGNSFIFRPVFQSLDKLIERAPLIKTVYSSVKDLLGAFVGQKKRFNQPVLIRVSENPLLERFGFVTAEDLSELGINKEKVAVYVPFSYAITGALFVVKRENITPIKAHAAEMMKFVVSGGVAELD